MPFNRLLQTATAVAAIAAVPLLGFGAKKGFEGYLAGCNANSGIEVYDSCQASAEHDIDDGTKLILAGLGCTGLAYLALGRVRNTGN